AGELITFTLSASDADEDPVYFSSGEVSGKESMYPSGSDLDEISGEFSWQTTLDDTGSYSIMFIATDGSDYVNTDTEEVIITVGDVNRPPVLTPIGDRQAVDNSNLSFTVTATDFENGNLTYSIEEVSPGAGLASGMSIDSDTQVFTWQIVGISIALGDYPVRFRVTDDGDPSESDFEDVTITVME
ncbi:MAG TPA: putative Ig domain-containing protein, partial [Deltaproteobacteria bacterium]|nr:putative Ig domain-containing protein [Deltaproteobacteria bacterium]